MDGVTYGYEKLETLLGREPPRIAVLQERQPLHELHREVRIACRRLASLQDLRDSRVIHQRQRLSLGRKPRTDFLGRESRANDLEGDVAANRTCLRRLVHRSHPALAQHSDYSIRTYCRRIRDASWMRSRFSCCHLLLQPCCGLHHRLMMIMSGSMITVSDCVLSLTQIVDTAYLYLRPDCALSSDCAPAGLALVDL